MHEVFFAPGKTPGTMALLTSATVVFDPGAHAVPHHVSRLGSQVRQDQPRIGIALVPPRKPRTAHRTLRHPQSTTPLQAVPTWGTSLESQSNFSAPSVRTLPPRLMRKNGCQPSVTMWRKREARIQPTVCQHNHGPLFGHAAFQTAEQGLPIGLP